MEALDFILKEGGGYSQDNQLQYFPALDVGIVIPFLKFVLNLVLIS